MPMNRKLYPSDWDAIATEIKEAANWECVDCGRPCRRPGESIDDFSDRLEKDHIDGKFNSELFDEVEDEETGGWVFVPRPQKFCLTVAHLDHVPSNCDHFNLKALCAPCHCRYDLGQMAMKKRLKKERNGQMTLDEIETASREIQVGDRVVSSVSFNGKVGTVKRFETIHKTEFVYVQFASYPDYPCLKSTLSLWEEQSKCYP